MTGLERVCDNASVGALIIDADGSALTFRRATVPAGIAGPAGHIDGHGEAIDALVAEVREEVGLRVRTASLLKVEWRPGSCRRLPGPGGIGHLWSLYSVQVDGELSPSARETRDTRWRTGAELQQLAERTVAYARGRVSAAQFAVVPGVEPVWARWFDMAGLIALTAGDLSAIEDLLRSTS